MKVAIIIERADTILGGAERSMLELAAALLEFNIDVDILAAKGNPQDNNAYILCTGGRGSRSSYSEFDGALRKRLQSNHYDILHSTLPFDFVDIYHPRGGTYIESILRNAASYQNRFVSVFKKLTAFGNRRRGILLAAERKLCRTSDGPVIVAISQYVAEQFKRHYNTNAARIITIPNGVATDYIADSNMAINLKRQIFANLKMEEVDKPVLFLFAANNFRLKGLGPLLNVMATSQRYILGAEKTCLVVAGKGKPDKYFRLAKKLGVEKRIVFLGQVPRIQEVLSVVDVAVLPTFYDPSSRFILEALAMGKPVITTRFNGATDIFINERHGKVIDSPENTAELGRAIRYFANHENIEQASKAIAADNLKETISVKRVAGQFLSVYESVMQRKRK
jgi:UDP-glucose:(heptosyl)LPS alpha-1,3-glucosyltransferase